MPSSDISKCSGRWRDTGEVCPLRNDCLRFTMSGNRLFNTYIAPAYNPDSKSCWNLIQAQKGEE